MASWDPRLWGTAPNPNLENTFDLQGRPLLVDSVDAGWQLNLLDQAGEAHSFWDGRGSQRHTEYDELQRPTTVTEQMKDDSPRVAERFAYGGAGAEFADHNQCGQPIRHDHPAGRRSLCQYGVGGLPLLEQTRFMVDLEPPDWSSEFAEARLEDKVFQTTQRYGPSGDMRCQSDAMGNVRFFAYDRAGQLSEARLMLAGSLEAPRLLVSEIHYDAFGRSISERAGNGVVTTARHAGDDGRLLQLQSRDAQGKPLQDLNYAYDPVGNITSIEDKAQLTQHFNSQRIDPVNCYGYDSLYQLIEATGREVSQPGFGPALPIWQTTPLDPNQLRNYTQTFNYDAAGNLQTRHHSGEETFEMFTSPASNRSVADRENLADGFDANGNQLALLRGQRMCWDMRNQLSRVTMVRRADGRDDTECYFYDSPGHRLRKVRLIEAARRTLVADVRYLPGLEIHRDTATGEERHVVSVEAGLSHVRVLRWVTKPPVGVPIDQLRYCLSDHLNSCTLELDEWGALLSREVYYAFGGTAIWAGSSEVEDRYKTIRYSGKERDATGLYYYGYRYYAPWLQRWVSADPAGAVDGVNFFIALFNNPVNWVDEEGQNAVPTIAHYYWGGGNINPAFLSNILTFKKYNPEYQMNVWTDKTAHILNTLSTMETSDDPAYRTLARQYGRDLHINESSKVFEGLAKIAPQVSRVESLFLRESNGPYRNIAAASDIFRIAALYVYGGLYMDVDVAIPSGRISRPQAPDGFAATIWEEHNGRLISNSILVAIPGFSHGEKLMAEMIDDYKELAKVVWTIKRSEPGARYDGTMLLTGPNSLNKDRSNSMASINVKDFGHRVPVERKGMFINLTGDPDLLFLRGIREGVADHSGWSKVCPGRRASISL
ncbi:RHS repeat-associated core domain-containing protein [Pseudomonas sp. PD9R]|uniref:RHS repeat-associated core domain-containing protein n=1 Tax=Pseudomonas sp. PD9R TaxID=2853534 RepID=UPI00210E25ED|nr:RHS repeat-associated core domain-containing protein [Pseudomonas sp. PD9R]